MAKLGDISAPRLLKLLLGKRAALRCIDVRSPGEFAQGSIPFFSNLPILDNQERHQIGICYKEEGQEKAIELGHQLVSDHKRSLIDSWLHLLGKETQGYVCCWRGGLRSRTAQEWIHQAGGNVLQVVGGYKGLRRELLKSFDHLPELLVLSGPTGSGKTRLLGSLQVPKLDLEKLANHRGSVFGKYGASAQPAQASFENTIAFELLESPVKHLLVEDESLMIGNVHLPLAIHKKLSLAPVVQIQESLEARVENILQEYVNQPLAAGMAPQNLQQSLEESVMKISKKLGGQKTTEVLASIRLGIFTKNQDIHKDWIRNLLEHYYDKAYAYGFKKSQRTIVFQGDWNECHHWIQKKFA